MTAPYSFQPLPVAPGVQPGPFQPAPTGGDYLQQGAGDLAKVLQALQQSSIQSRQVANEYDLGQGQLGVRNAELQQKAADEQYKQQQAAEAQRKLAMAGKGLRQMLAARGVTGLDQVPDESVVGLVPELEKAGVIGPLTDAERRLTAYGQYAPITAPVAKEFLGPAPGTQITVNNVGEREHAKALANVAGDLYKKALEDGQAAMRLLPNIANARQLVDKSFTGVAANAKLGVARLLSAVGVKPAGDQAADTQTLIRYARENTLVFLGSRALGSGTAVSDKDREYMAELSGENLKLEPQALKKIFRINYGTQIMKTQDAINELRQQAIDYPADAAQLSRRALTLERQLQPMWQEYGKMLQEEHQGDKQQSARDKQDIRKILGRPIGDQQP